ncbi:cytochrome P450 [Streptomyces sp. SL13]|uniref:Cytochrome P450 n=1 Tax=Streptantibioticus silvisoli TaxID=2705255 RepID=A0AA90GUN7_9ACTN|nr:cytochrome P450 [Streptantibioticus silvisoli]MDI5968388.1 cytochrome P450 [Streptantibioticus silvisoli]
MLVGEHAEGVGDRGGVAGRAPFITQATNDLLDAWPVNGRADVVDGLAVPLPVIVICELLGVPGTDRPLVQRWSTELFAAGQPERTDETSHAVAGYMTDLIATKRARPGCSLLDHLIDVRDGSDRLADDELVSLAVLLLVAGHETTTNFIGNAVLALLQHPAALERLRRSPEEVPAALDELLRFDSPVSTATFRFTTESLVLGGTEIPARAPVLISLGAANRDPDRFAAPDRLDLDRDAAGHLSFGHGIHRCLGAPLAKAEADIALRTLLLRFPRLRAAVPPDQLNWRKTRLVRGLAGLPVLT